MSSAIAAKPAGTGAPSERIDARLSECSAATDSPCRTTIWKNNHVHEKPSGRSARAPRSHGKPHLPGLSGRSVRHLNQVRAVRAVRRNFLAFLAALGVMIAASITVPAYAESVAEAQLPQPQVVTMIAAAPIPAVERDTYTVVAPPPLRWPLDSLKVASGFGARVAPCDGCSSFHEGVDFDPGFGAQVHAIAAGVVVETDNPNYAALGVYVAIEHVIDGQKIVSVYGHMQYGSMPLSVGDTVKVGQVIGLVGSTGASTGPHLHFEIRVNGTQTVNPYTWMRARLG